MRASPITHTAFPGARIETVPSAAFSTDLRALLAAPFKIAARHRPWRSPSCCGSKPAAVIGFGGYPSVPVMLAASLRALPTAIIEQNAVVGRANRLVMNKVKLVAAAFPIARFAPKDMSKIVLTGNPCGPKSWRCGARLTICRRAGGPLRLLVFGGSQGARAFSEIVPAALTLSAA